MGSVLSWIWFKKRKMPCTQIPTLYKLDMGKQGTLSYFQFGVDDAHVNESTKTYICVDQLFLFHARMLGDGDLDTFSDRLKAENARVIMLNRQGFFGSSVHIDMGKENNLYKTLCMMAMEKGFEKHGCTLVAMENGVYYALSVLNFIGPRQSILKACYLLGMPGRGDVVTLEKSQYQRFVKELRLKFNYHMYFLDRGRALAASIRERFEEQGDTSEHAKRIGAYADELAATILETMAMDGAEGIVNDYRVLSWQEGVELEQYTTIPEESGVDTHVWYLPRVEEEEEQREERRDNLWVYETKEKTGLAIGQENLWDIFCSI